MADIELVIKLDEEYIKQIDRIRFLIGGREYRSLQINVINAIKNGTPLPKGHGRLIDVDDIRVIELEDSLHFMQYKKGDETDVYIDAPTIIEADKEQEDGNDKQRMS